jgi:LacI family transcriptional regulator
MATIRDVAKMAKVSVATVSRVLNKSGYVHKDTEERVSEVIKSLGYETNLVTRETSADKKNGTIALIVPDISNPFFSELTRAVEEFSRCNGFNIILCNSDDQGHKEKSYIETLTKRNIEGIIFVSTSLAHNDIAEIDRLQIPYVFIDRAPNSETFTVIRVKNYEGAKLAVQHLLEMGCRKIAHIYGPQEFPAAKDRLKGYEDAVSHYSWYSPSLLVPGFFRIDGGKHAIEVLLKRHPDVDGIFISSDMMAVGALKALHNLGVKVPDQIAVCGFDGIGITELVNPDITTVAQPIEKIGSFAAELLIKKIKGVLMEDRVYELEVSLIPRKSTAKSTSAENKDFTLESKSLDTDS